MARARLLRHCPLIISRRVPGIPHPDDHLTAAHCRVTVSFGVCACRLFPRRVSGEPIHPTIIPASYCGVTRMCVTACGIYPHRVHDNAGDSPTIISSGPLPYDISTGHCVLVSAMCSDCISRRCPIRPLVNTHPKRSSLPTTCTSRRVLALKRVDPLAHPINFAAVSLATITLGTRPPPTPWRRHTEVGLPHRKNRPER